MTRMLILGSSSKPRKMLLERLKIPFEIVSPDIDETPQAGESPEKLVQRLAKEKAKKIAQAYPDAIIISADQVGVLNNEVLCKPLDIENAMLQLKKMSGNAVEFFIGLCVFDVKNNHEQIALENFSVSFRQLTQKMIENYVKKENVLECAGSFKAEGLGIVLVEKFHGDDFTALIGLPMIRLINMLEKMGVEII